MDDRSESQQNSYSANLNMEIDVAQLKLKQQIEKGGELDREQIHDRRELDGNRQATARWSRLNETLLARMFATTTIANAYRQEFGDLDAALSVNSAMNAKLLHQFRRKAMDYLTTIQDQLEVMTSATSPRTASTQVSRNGRTMDKRVFIVHGHSELYEKVARYIEKLGLKPIILHEQPSEGRSLLEKLEHHGDVTYAVILLTPDDVGGTSTTELRARARQNVILELGYFLGRLGRNRVCALHSSEVELPSDYLGVVYINSSSDGWKIKLARELKAARLPVISSRIV